MIVPHGEGVDPVAACLALGVEPRVETREDHYVIALPEGVTEAQFRDALKLDPAAIHRAKEGEAEKRRVREVASARIEKRWPLWKQINAALGVYGPQKQAECRDFIKAEIALVDAEDARIANLAKG